MDGGAEDHSAAPFWRGNMRRIAAAAATEGLECLRAKARIIEEAGSMKDASSPPPPSFTVRKVMVVWDLLAARRARSLGVGLLSGGYGREELEQAGAYRVYADPEDLLRHLDEVGVRLPEAGA